ncbi:kremen protein 1-like [Ptychodera flava]|uniref:kremen protein 1-like n=1 Tax=Ptychodera flava TaxID=63121 RepID=UPI00396AAF98
MWNSGRVWQFWDADVVCNQLRYNGTMRSGREDGLLRNDSRRVVDHVTCPENSTTIDDCSFDIEEPGHCTDAAMITCNFDGYIGCFNNNASDPVLPDDEEENNAMTIEWCLDYCRERNWTYAGLYWRKYCHCGRQGTDYARHGESRTYQCSTPCGGNYRQICGGSGTRRISIYQTHLGACGGKVSINRSRTIYSPGFPGYYPILRIVPGPYHPQIQ